MLDDLFNNKQGANVMSESGEHVNAPNPSTKRYRVLMEDNVETVALGDYGAYFSAIDSQATKY